MTKCVFDINKSLTMASSAVLNWWFMDPTVVFQRVRKSMLHNAGIINVSFVQEIYVGKKFSELNQNI